MRRQPAALSLLATVVALCGCDFVEVKGVRLDHALPVLRDIVRKEPEQLDHMALLFAERPAKVGALLALQHFFSKYVKALEDVPRMKAMHNASNHCQAQLCRRCGRARTGTK